MTKKRDPFAPARDVIVQLAHLTHDELRDLADMLTADAATDPRDIPPRHGLPPLFPDDGHSLILNGGWQYRDKPPRYTEPARRELKITYLSAKELLTAAAQGLIIDVARQLQNALAPIAERRIAPDGKPLAHGNVQTKIIRRKVFNPETMQTEIRAFGPYLYYRYSVSGGDADKRGKRKKNKYIGKQPLALLFDQTEPGSDARRELERQIIEAMNAGKIDDLMIALGLDDEPDSSEVLGIIPEIPNTPQTTITPDNAPVFLPDYQPAPTRKQIPKFFALTEVHRVVLAAYAAGMNYQADYAEGIQKRKIARELVEAGLLVEITGYVDHRKHNWRLTAAGLSLIRRDTDLQQRIAGIVEPGTRLIGAIQP